MNEMSIETLKTLFYVVLGIAIGGTLVAIIVPVRARIRARREAIIDARIERIRRGVESPFGQS